MQNNNDAMNDIELGCKVEYLMGMLVCWKVVQWKSIDKNNIEMKMFIILCLIIISCCKKNGDILGRGMVVIKDGLNYKNVVVSILVNVHKLWCWRP